MRKVPLLLTVALLALSPALTNAAEAPTTPPPPVPASVTGPLAPVQATFTDAQRAEIENIIKDYLTTKHPEVMAEGLQALQQRDQQIADAKARTAVGEARDRLFNDPHSPVAGNPKADVAVVEFFDYQCGYCKMSEDGLEKLLKDDKNVKVIYKDFPILGPVSVEASKASLASVKQGKFQAFHDALMSKKDHITSESIYETAKDVGIDVDKLKKDMGDQSIGDLIAANLKLGQDIGARGTPMFIINDSVYPGALQADQLKQAVQDARAKKK